MKLSRAQKSGRRKQVVAVHGDQVLLYFVTKFQEPSDFCQMKSKVLILDAHKQCFLFVLCQDKKKVLRFDKRLRQEWEFYV